MDQSPVDAGSARVAELLAQILERMDAIEARQAAIEADLPAASAPPTPTRASATAGSEPPTETEAGTGTEPSTHRALSRRKLLTGAAGLTAAGVAVAAGSTPAAATNGQPILAGQDNTATAATTITASGTSTAALGATNSNAAGAGVYAQTVGPSTLSGFGALTGNSSVQRGVVGLSKSTFGVWGESKEDTGVGGAGSRGVHGIGTSIGLLGQSVTGTAIQTVSNHVQIRLAPGARGAPTEDSVLHYDGDTVVDSSGDLWFCTAAGTPGTWRRLSGGTTAGSFHVLPAPARIYDSRPGSAPAVGSKTPLTNTPRVLSCNVNSSGVPAGATAVALTVLLVNAANANGNMTVWANGAPRPQANTMVWGSGSGRYTSSTISAIDAQTRLQVVASASTDVVLDVVGYYR